MTSRRPAKTTTAFGWPQSHFCKAAVKPTAPPLPRPDVDNIGKAVLDGLQQVIGDDTKVARLVVEKAWGSESSTTLTIAAGLEGAAAAEPAGRRQVGSEAITRPDGSVALLEDTPL